MVDWIGSTMKASVIDLGFNSLKMVTYDVKADNSFSSYEHRSIAAMLGENMNETGFLGAEPIERTIRGLKLFKEMVSQESIKQVLPIATSAVREAANREAFLKQVYQETGFRFRVLSGKEEAQLSFLGAIRASTLQSVLFFDIGGGSLELLHYEKSKIRKIMSLPLGAYRLTQLYADKHGDFSGKSYDKMKQRINELMPSRDELAPGHDTVLLGVGGTVRAIARYHQDLTAYPLYKLHNYSMKREDVESIHTFLSGMNWEAISAIDSIGDDRARTIVAGSSVVSLLMSKLGFSKLVVSTHGLRDGVLSAYLENPLSYHKGDAIRFRSPKASRRNSPFVHSRNLIGAFKHHGLINEKDLLMLSCATSQVLEGVGPFPPETIFHMIVSEEADLAHRDQLTEALAVVRTIRPSVADWLYMQYRSILKPKSRSSIKRLAALLELVEIVEKSALKTHVAMDEKNVKIRAFPNSKGFLPESLLAEAMDEVGQAFDLSATIKFVRGLGGPEAPRTSEQTSIWRP
jgi:exopolyphosphatase / guanosine-5'-triphosphate,3'-diphosphate pyrophosphatase